MKLPRFSVLGVAAICLTGFVVSSCSSTPTSPTATAIGGSSSPGVPSAVGDVLNGGVALNTANNGRGGGGGGNNDGGGGGTAYDFIVTMTGKLQTSNQAMQNDRDNKKALAASGTIEPGELTVDFSAWLDDASCTWTAGYGWNSPEIEALKTTMSSTLGRRDVNFQISHSGDGITGDAGVRMLANPEGSDNWLSYCFNTGFGLCQSVLTSDPADPVRVYELDGGGIRAVGPGQSPSEQVHLACPDTTAGSDVTLTVAPI